MAVRGVEVAKEGEAPDKSGLEVKNEGSHLLFPAVEGAEVVLVCPASA